MFLRVSPIVQFHLFFPSPTSLVQEDPAPDRDHAVPRTEASVPELVRTALPGRHVHIAVAVPSSELYVILHLDVVQSWKPLGMPFGR
jgi:hypothetical protein